MLEISTKMKNKDFALSCINTLLSRNLLSEKMLFCLTNLEWCQREFGTVTRVPVLKEIPSNCFGTEFKLLLNDGTNQSRYYPDIICANGKKYVVTNYWYGPETRMKDNKTPFLEWVNLQIQ